MQRKLEKCYVYNISVSASPLLSASTYIQWHAMKWEGGNLSSSPTFKNFVLSTQNIVGKFSQLPLFRSV